MSATSESTAAYLNRFPDIYTTQLGRTGLRVSGAGFGCYRVSRGVPEHHNALSAALDAGINLIDTSANYADGASEQLVGDVLREKAEQGEPGRGAVVVVTKGGYIQGSNYKMVQQRAEAGEGFPEVTEYAQGLWHCIAPEFLEDQITRSLNRLGLPGVDVFLLHNPEYYLNHAAKTGMDLQEARAEYYRRVRMAFAYLETEAGRGRIGWYGISSNTFAYPADHHAFTSLEECVKIAESLSLTHRFGVIQMPANLYEHGFVTQVNQSQGRAVMDIAVQKSLGVLINRPLNAIVDDALVRLADFPLAAHPANAASITALTDTLIAEERKFGAAMLEDFAADPEAKRALKEFISVGFTMQRYWNTFQAIEQYNDVLSQHFAPRLGYAEQYLGQNGTDAHKRWYEAYAQSARQLLREVGAYYSAQAQERSDTIRAAIAQVLPEVPVTESLSSTAIRLLLGVPGISCVLTGMRRTEYVEDVLSAINAGPLGDTAAWSRLQL